MGGRELGGGERRRRRRGERRRRRGRGRNRQNRRLNIRVHNDMTDKVHTFQDQQLVLGQCGQVISSLSQHARGQEVIFHLHEHFLGFIPHHISISLCSGQRLKGEGCYEEVCHWWKGEECYERCVIGGRGRSVMRCVIGGRG